MKGWAIASAVRENLGISILSRSASRVKRPTLSEAEETYNETFQRPSYAEEFLRLNPGSWFQVCWSRVGEFLSFDVAANNIVNIAMKVGLRTYAIDACTFKGEHYCVTRFRPFRSSTDTPTVRLIEICPCASLCATRKCKIYTSTT